MPIRITLEAALQNADVSGRELARRVKCHNDTISKYRHNAVREVSLDLLERFCAALGCQLSDLLSDQPESALARPIVQPLAASAAPRLDERPVTIRMPRPTLAELQTLIARQNAGTFRPGDAQRLSDIMTYWPCWEMTDAEWDAW